MTPISLDKDVEALRKEYQEISARVVKLALIGLTVLFLLVVTFSRAIDRVNSEEIRSTVRMIDRLSDGGPRPEMSYVFNFFAERGDEPPVPKPPATVDREAARARAEQLAQELEAKAAQWFALKPSLFGMSFEADLRYWFPVLPFLVWTGATHLSILRRKMRLLRRVAAHRVGADAGAATSLDRLLFVSNTGRASFYARHPSQFETFVYLALAAGLLGYFVVATAPFWRLWERNVQAAIVVVLATVTFYFGAYARHVGAVLDAQAAALDVAAPPDRIDRIWAGLWRRLLSLARGVARWPRPSLTVGGALVLVTLVLSTATSCRTGPKTGYELLRGRNEATWFTVDFIWGGYSAQPVGRGAYAVSLLLAALGLFLVAISMRRARILESAVAACWLARAAGIVASFVVVEVSFVYVFGIAYIGDVCRVLFWILPAGLWALLAFSTGTSARMRWRRARAAIAVLYFPGILFAMYGLFRVIKGGLPGVPVYTTGVLLMFLGYLGALRAIEPPRDGA